MSAVAGHSVTRLSADGIEALIGTESFKYLGNKNRGGENGFKGARYEQFFGAHRIARLARKLIEQGENAQVEWQSEGFVDDLVVRRDGALSFKGYQLKNSATVSWTAGEHPIETDFAMQHQICSSEHYTDIRLRLVCSDSATAAGLKESVPASIGGYSGAAFFPYSEKQDRLLYDHSWLVDDFAYLSRNPMPQVVDASQVACALVGAWASRGPQALVSDVLDLARKTSPSLLRTLQSDGEAIAQLRPEVIHILDAIPAFHYHVERGFLWWEACGGSTSGALSRDCFSSWFQTWQSNVLKLAPTSFDEIEVTLQ